ncbi:MAG: SEC-C domain-containing protein, partial [Clostridia bacterium]|nr:SEC-C domain-containing protein [Clostridia bacterium]
LHQAIEAKEGVVIEKENKTLATITFQNYFRMYGKLSGMTGTALTEEEEFREIYALDVIEIPTNMPMIRVDHSDVVYKNVEGKYRAIIEQIKACYAKGQPVLVGTVSVEKSEMLSARLRKEKIPHHVLNAKYHDREAEIVAQAGKYGAVTISTNMAGRGTDIMLGGNPEFMAKSELRAQGVDEALIAQANGTSLTDDPAVLGVRAQYAELYEQFKEQIAPEAQMVRDAGGLFIVGTERHESRRIDNQLRGRSGRQGDPGESRFFLSLEDDLMRLFGSEKIAGMVERIGMTDDTPIDAKILSGSIQSAQQRIEDQNFKRRKYVLSYDDVMNQQRNIIYKQRQEVLEDTDISLKILHMIGESIKENVAAYTGDEGPETWNLEGLRSVYMGFLCDETDFHYTEKELSKLTKKALEQYLMDKAEQKYNEKEELFGDVEFREVERAVLLRIVDTAWMEHIDAMDDLKSSIGLQAYAQRDPVTEYRIVGGDAFDAMICEIREKTVRTILSVIPRREEVQRVQVATPLQDGFEGQGKKTFKKISVVRREAPKVGRNDPCPCGSGKKYKNCCGMGK